MIYCVRGPTRWQGLMKVAVWLGLVMGAGCASDPSMEELDEAVGEQEESVNMADDSYADNDDNSENIYNDLNVSRLLKVRITVMTIWMLVKVITSVNWRIT